MDRFSRTLLAASAESGLATITLSRHVPSLRRNLRSDDEVLMLTPCLRAGGGFPGEFLLLLSKRRLVMTRQSKLLNRIRLSVDAPIAELSDVKWTTEPSTPGIEVAFTYAEERHRFWISAQHSRHAWRLEAALARTFRRPLQSIAEAALALRNWDFPFIRNSE
ncbi:hypothetical protein [Phytomonospora endophytica]|uniref:Bacterial Pleckstrin homology domain-containing protein n=1 Tax=Phytomonospora endophytica TaxID=714109 RepID=A0A841FI16_9ACTN|nr:hypothetical protein [Phytomonospora endophytica]MBB6035504.1 hypothetical protein [Phytomonospora endophytica]GIG63743.1 hypothetical protein Pen01_00380 [Phytomonospora endophytica]